MQQAEIFFIQTTSKWIRYNVKIEVHITDCMITPVFIKGHSKSAKLSVMEQFLGIFTQTTISWQFSINWMRYTVNFWCIFPTHPFLPPSLLLAGVLSITSAQDIWWAPYGVSQGRLTSKCAFGCGQQAHQLGDVGDRWSGTWYYWSPGSFTCQSSRSAYPWVLHMSYNKTLNHWYSGSFTPLTIRWQQL